MRPNNTRKSVPWGLQIGKSRSYEYTVAPKVRILHVLSKPTGELYICLASLVSPSRKV